MPPAEPAGRPAADRRRGLRRLTAALVALLACVGARAVPGPAAPAPPPPTFEPRDGGGTLCATFPLGVWAPAPARATSLGGPLAQHVVPPPVFAFTLQTDTARLRVLAPRLPPPVAPKAAAAAAGGPQPATFCADARPHRAPGGRYRVAGALHRALSANQVTVYPLGEHWLPPPPGAGAPRPAACSRLPAFQPGHWTRPASPAGDGVWAEWVSPCHGGERVEAAVRRLIARMRKAPVWVQLVGDSATRGLLWDLCLLLNPGSAYTQMWQTGRSDQGDLMECSVHYPDHSPDSLLTFQWFPLSNRSMLDHPAGRAVLARWRAERQHEALARGVVDPAGWLAEVAGANFSDFRALRRGLNDTWGRPASSSLFRSFDPEAASDVLVLSPGAHFPALPLPLFGDMVRRMCTSVSTYASARPAAGTVVALGAAANASLVPRWRPDEAALRALPYEAARTDAALDAARVARVGVVDLFSPLLAISEWSHSDVVHVTPAAGAHMAAQLARAILAALEALDKDA